MQSAVLAELQWPWFRWIENPDGSQVSEDIFFFRKANAAGYRVTVDPQVVCRHDKVTNLTEFLLRKEERNHVD